MITAVLNNPEDRKLSVTATVTVRYVDRTNPDGKLENRSVTDTITFKPSEQNKKWILPVPGTNSTTEGTITDWDLTTEVSPP